MRTWDERMARKRVSRLARRVLVGLVILAVFLATLYLAPWEPLRVQHGAYPSLLHGGRVLLSYEEAELFVGDLTHLTERAAVVVLRVRGFSSPVWEVRFTNGSSILASSHELIVQQSGSGVVRSVRVRGIPQPPEVALQVDAHVYTRGEPLSFSRGVPVLLRVEWEREIFSIVIGVLLLVLLVLLAMLIRTEELR